MAPSRNRELWIFFWGNPSLWENEQKSKGSVQTGRSDTSQGSRVVAVELELAGMNGRSLASAGSSASSSEVEMLMQEQLAIPFNFWENEQKSKGSVQTGRSDTSQGSRVVAVELELAGMNGRSLASAGSSASSSEVEMLMQEQLAIPFNFWYDMYALRVSIVSLIKCLPVELIEKKARAR
ncbi:hypothetical protein SAY86_018715 [Trapa natans]|uniref:Uncharacterized protein n=1 Tax=Trapa natans TaxID=22666 RepID=A0AAN7LD68_TRANT|nr:hypothetical protein SAY86_018715 [Trapa natans]